jgi:hypothetical protein
MAVFRGECGSVLIEIFEVDHGPAHCHVSGLPGGAKARVSLLTLEVTKPPGMKLPRPVAKFLKLHQEDMLEAWERVVSI